MQTKHHTTERNLPDAKIQIKIHLDIISQDRLSTFRQSTTEWERDLRFGKPPLCQLSYYRIARCPSVPTGTDDRTDYSLYATDYYLPQRKRAPRVFETPSFYILPWRTIRSKVIHNVIKMRIQTLLIPAKYISILCSAGNMEHSLRTNILE